MLFVACEFWTTDKMKQISETAVIIHNMIVEKRRQGYTSDGTAGRSSYIEPGELVSDIIFTFSSPGDTPIFLNSNVKVSDDIKVKGFHRDLIRSLIEHQWKAFGGDRKFLLK